MANVAHFKLCHWQQQQQLQLVLCLFMIMLCSPLWLVLEGAAAMSPDTLALLQFKGNFSNGDETLWNWFETDPCEGPVSWIGVTCVPGTNDSVAELRLPSGALPDGRRLHYKLNGTLSSSLGSLPNLTRLQLSGHMLSGPIPPEIANATLLFDLDLSDNQLLNGSIPASINELPLLASLSLWGNSLSGSIPSLHNLTKLQTLYLSGNNLSGPVPNLATLTNLSELVLGGTHGTNNLAPGAAPDLSNLHALSRLELSGSEIEGVMPTWIASMPNLTILDMSFNHLTGPIPEDIWSNTSLLESVDLSANRLNGSIPAQLLRQLRPGQARALNLSNNALTGGIPDELNTVTFPDPVPIPSVNYLSIDVSSNQLDGPIPSTFQHPWIERLWLHNNRLSGDITSFWVIILEGGSAILSELRLQELRLQDNLFTGELGPEVATSMWTLWKNLRILDLSRNAEIRLVNDCLSVMLSSLTLLEELRLSGVRGSAKLPVFALNRTSPIPALRVLDLSRSGLEEDLSQSQLMADAPFLFPNLQSLDLSGNRLTGAIPLSFTRMSNLSFLNLANNRLSGRIPNLPPHLLKAEFFAGNPNLCGFPLRECSHHTRKLVLHLVAGLVACVVLLAGTCLFFASRLRRHSKRHPADASNRKQDSLAGSRIV